MKKIILKIKFITLTFLLLCLSQFIFASTTWYVSTTGADNTGNGTVGTPYRTLGKAISVAASGDNISIAAGTYNSASNGGTRAYNDYGNTINVSNLTISGAGIGSTVYSSTSGTFATISSSGANISGISITGANGSSGGGLYINAANATISTCAFTSCTANSSPHEGAAAYINSTGASFTSCTFTSNSCWYGGAIYAVQAVSFTSCTFTSNTATDGGSDGKGGAVEILKAAGATAGASTFSKCTFANNTADYSGGAIYYNDAQNSTSSTLTCNNCLFYGNAAGYESTIFIETSAGSTSSFPNTFNGCTIYHPYTNTYTASYPIYNAAGYTLVENSILCNGGDENSTTTIAVLYSTTNTTVKYSAGYHLNTNFSASSNLDESIAATLFYGNRYAPTYTSTADFYLQPSSPAVATANATTAGTYPSNTTDLNGNLRSVSTPCMGALEFGGCGTTYSGTLTIGPTGTFGNITACIDTLKQCGWTGNLILQLQSTYTSTAETFPIDFNGLSTVAATKTLTFEPATGATGLTVTSSNATGTMKFDGQSYITFNGSPNAANTMLATNLIISNTSTTGYAVGFVNDANNITFQYCNIESDNTTTTAPASATSASPGTISIFKPNAAAGNNNLTIQYNTITTATAGMANYPTYAIYSVGLASDINQTITINGNHIADYANSTSATNSYGVYLSDYNQTWTIENNLFYEEASITTAGTFSNAAIYVNTSTTGSAFTITGNTIGFNASTQAGVESGTYTISSAGTPTFYGIYVNEVSGTSTIENNTIESISVGSTTAANGATFYGVYTTGAGAPTIETNTIGGSANTIAVGTSGTTTSGIATFYGVYTAASGAPTIETNTVSYITTYGTTATGGSTAYGIYNVPASGTPAATINSNTITNITHGSGYTTGVATFYGIESNSGGTSSINSNTVESVSVASAVTSGSASFYGIYTTGSGAPTVETNTIGASSYTVTVGGSSITGAGTTTFAGIKNSSTGTAIIESNTIQNITNYGLTTAITSYGIWSNPASASPTIESNTIQALTIGSSVTTAANTFYAIYTSGTGAPTIESNTIGNTSTSNSIVMGVSGTTTSSVWTFYGIYNACTSNTASTITANTIENVTTYATTGTGNAFGIFSNTNGSTAQQSITSNTVSTITIGSSNTSASNTFSGICYNTNSGAGTFSITSNTISTITLGASSSTGVNVFYGIDDQNGSPSYVNGGTSSCSSNIIKTVTVYGSGAGSSLYGIDLIGSATHGAGTINILNNIVGGSASNDMYLVVPNVSMASGISLPYYGTAVICSFNTVRNFTVGATASTGVSMYLSGIYMSNQAGSNATPSAMIKANNISNLISNTTATPAAGNTNYFIVSGIFYSGNNTNSSTSADTIVQNRISGLTNLANGTNGAYSGVNLAGTYGMFFTCGTGSSGKNFTDYIYNNFIDLTLTSSTNGQNYMAGIYFNGSNGSPTISMYYNTIYLHGSETFVAGNTNFASYCYYCNSNTVSSTHVLIRNNIFLNQITSTNYKHAANGLVPGSTANPQNAGPYIEYNYVEVANSSYYSSSGPTSTATWNSTYTTHDVNTYASGTVVPSSPSGSISPTMLNDVSTGADLQGTLYCTYDINGYAGGTGGDAANRSTGAGHLGCWEDAGGFYWISGNGNWSDYTNHWVTSSNGSIHTGSAPGQYDNAYFDGFSGAGTCTIDVAATCNNLTCTGYTGNFAGSQSLSIAGNLAFAAGMGTNTNTYSGTLNFAPAPTTATTYTINVASETLLGPATFTYTTANAATWNLAVATTINGAITLTKGTLVLSSHTLTLGSSTAPTLTSGIITANAASDMVAFTNGSSITLPTSLFTNNTLTGLTMNGAGGVTIQEGLSITNNLTLTAGVLDIGSTTLTLGAPGTDITSVTANTGTSTSWIKANNASGGVQQFVNNNSTTYQFPVGDATHSTPINFNFTSGTASAAYLTVYTLQTTMPKFNTAMSNYLNRYWSVVASGISSPNYAVNYYYNAADIHTSFTKMDPIEQINPTTPTYPQWVIPSGTVSNATAGGSWTPTFTNSSYKLGAATWTSATNAVSWTGLTQLPTVAHSLFGGADDQATVLPIELVMFTANPLGKTVLLNWETASELDNAYFTIEKTKDGVNFEKVTQVAGAGNSAEKLYYAAVDSTPFAGLSYYRLKQTDFDGKYSYSNLVPVNFNGLPDTDEFVLYPNPVNNGLLNLSYIGKRGAEMMVYFYDIQGRLVATQVVPSAYSGPQLVNVYPTQGLNAGVYMVKGVSDSISFVKKVVVQ